MSTYAVTIKYIKQGELATEEQLRNIYLNLVYRHSAEMSEVVFETDSLGRLHLHSSFKARKNIKYSLFKVPYVHIYIVPLPTPEDIYNWNQYIHKEEKVAISDYLRDVKDEYMFQ
jgi:hypothetical protein